MNKRKILLLLMVFVLFIGLTGCGGDNQVPIHDSVNWYETITIVPLGFLLEFFAGLVGNSFAFGILCLTILVRTCAWPIYAKTSSLSLKMQLLNPELQKLQEKYATRKDPESQQRMQMEMFALYKKHGVNVLGCLLPIVQMPIFIAMYSTVVRIAIPSSGEGETLLVSRFFGGAESTLDQMLFGIIDLSQGCELLSFSIILPILVAGTMGLLQWLSSRKPSYAKKSYSKVVSQQAQQSQSMMKVMSIVMIGGMAFASLSNAALAFYWVVGNTYAIGQNLIGRYLNERKYERMQNRENIII